MRLGIVASSDTYSQHLAPIWDALELQERVCFSAEPQGDADIWLTASARDHNQVWRLPGHKVVMEHGCGLEFYSHQVLSRRIRADLIAAPNEFIAERYRAAGARGRIEVIGTPKMDALSWIPTPAHDTVCVTFHWSGHLAAGAHAARGLPRSPGATSRPCEAHRPRASPRLGGR